MKTCSFCHKRVQDVAKLVESEAGPCICDECIGLAMQLFKRESPHVFFRIVKFDACGIHPCDAPSATVSKRDELEQKLAALQRRLADAGDRRDGGECDYLDAEIEAVEAEIARLPPD